MKVSERIFLPKAGVNAASRCFLEEYTDNLYLSADSACQGKPVAVEAAWFFAYGTGRPAFGSDPGGDAHLSARGGDLAL